MTMTGTDPDTGTDPGTDPGTDIGAARPFPRLWPSLGWILFYMIVQFICTIAAMAVAAAGDPSTMTAAMNNPETEMSNPSIAMSVVWGHVGAGINTLM